MGASWTEAGIGGFRVRQCSSVEQGERQNGSLDPPGRKVLKPHRKSHKKFPKRD
jgi:hypothetical protein